MLRSFIVYDDGVQDGPTVATLIRLVYTASVIAASVVALVVAASVGVPTCSRGVRPCHIW